MAAPRNASPAVRLQWLTDQLLVAQTLNHQLRGLQATQQRLLASAFAELRRLNVKAADMERGAERLGEPETLPTFPEETR